MVYTGWDVYNHMHANPRMTQTLDAAQQATVKLKTAYDELAVQLSSAQGGITEFWQGAGAEQGQAGLTPMISGAQQTAAQLDKTQAAMAEVSATFTSTKDKMIPLGNRPNINDYDQEASADYGAGNTAMPVAQYDIDAAAWDKNAQSNVDNYEPYWAKAQALADGLKDPAGTYTYPTGQGTMVDGDGHLTYPPAGTGNTGNLPGAPGMGNAPNQQAGSYSSPQQPGPVTSPNVQALSMPPLSPSASSPSEVSGSTLPAPTSTNPQSGSTSPSQSNLANGAGSTFNPGGGAAGSMGSGGAGGLGGFVPMAGAGFGPMGSSSVGNGSYNGGGAYGGAGGSGGAAAGALGKGVEGLKGSGTVPVTDPGAKGGAVAGPMSSSAKAGTPGMAGMPYGAGAGAGGRNEDDDHQRKITTTAGDPDSLFVGDLGRTAPPVIGE